MIPTLTLSALPSDGPSGAERDELIRALADLLAELGPGSMFHLQTALAARQVEGVSGTLEIIVPRKGRDHVDVKWNGGL